MPNCPNGCAGAPAFVRARHVFHGDTTNTWHCRTCGETWDETTSGRDAFFGDVAPNEKLRELRTVVGATQLDVTAPRE